MGLVDTIGRRRCLWLFMIGASIFTTPLLRADAPNPGDANGSLDIIALFCTRMFAYGAFIVLFIYTPELYPTKIRSFAFGLYNALSRLGGLVSPFIAVDLFQKVRPWGLVAHQHPLCMHHCTQGTRQHVCCRLFADQFDVCRLEHRQLQEPSLERVCWQLLWLCSCQ